jgi:hypothetical protein
MGPNQQYLEVLIYGIVGGSIMAVIACFKNDPDLQYLRRAKTYWVLFVLLTLLGSVAAAVFLSRTRGIIHGVPFELAVLSLTFFFFRRLGR